VPQPLFKTAMPMQIIAPGAIVFTDSPQKSNVLSAGLGLQRPWLQMGIVPAYQPSSVLTWTCRIDVSGSYCCTRKLHSGRNLQACDRRPQLRVLRDQFAHFARVDRRRLDPLLEVCGDRRAKAGARVSAAPTAENPIIAYRHVGEAGAVQVQCRCDEAEFRSERGKETGIERRDGAGAPNHDRLAVEDDFVARVRIGVGGDVWDHATGAVRRPGLSRRHRKKRRVAASGAFSRGFARVVVPDSLSAAVNLLRSAAPNDVRRRSRQVDICSARAAVAGIVVARGGKHNHARVCRRDRCLL